MTPPWPCSILTALPPGQMLLEGEECWISVLWFCEPALPRRDPAVCWFYESIFIYLPWGPWMNGVFKPRKPLKEGAGILGKGRESDISKCFYVLSVSPPSPITSEKGTEKSEFWCRTSGFEFIIQLLCDSGQVVSPLRASVSFPKETRHPSSWVVAKN